MSPKLRAWIFWEVAFPLLLPPAASLIIVYFIWTGSEALHIKWSTIFEFAPWGLCFFTLTLIGSILRRTRQNHTSRPAVFYPLLIITAVLAMYSGLILLWRQEENWHPVPSVWITSILLTIIGTALCYGLER